jgi:hypothetical protein
MGKTGDTSRYKSEIMKGADNLGDLGVDGKIIFQD